MRAAPRRAQKPARARAFRVWVLALTSVGFAGPLQAGEADAVAVKVRCRGAVCSFAVTVRHDDSGWKHYADRWEVLDMDGNELATRVLRHPHVDEQPFTRKLDRVKIPEGVTRVRIRAHDLVHGYGGEEVEADIPQKGKAKPTAEAETES